MTPTEFENELLFKLYEFCPGEWTLVPNPMELKKSIHFNGKPTGFCVTCQCLYMIETIPDPVAIIDETVKKIMESVVEGKI